MMKTSLFIIAMLALSTNAAMASEPVVAPVLVDTDIEPVVITIDLQELQTGLEKELIEAGLRMQTELQSQVSRDVTSSLTAGTPGN
jgi:hypothetical protein